MTDREETRARPNGDARASRADTHAGGGKQIILGTSRLESRVIVAPPDGLVTQTDLCGALA